MNLHSASTPINKRTIIILLCLLAVLLTLGLSVAQVEAAPLEGTLTARVLPGNLNVRSGPSLGYAVVTTLGEGEFVTLVGRNDGAAWVQVSSGWVASGSVELVGGGTYLDLPLTAKFEASAYVTTGQLNMRTGPGATYSVITTLHQYDGMGLIGRNHNASWVYVRTPGQVFGWVSSLYVKTGIDIMNLPVSTDTGSGGGGSVPPTDGGTEGSVPDNGGAGESPARGTGYVNIGQLRVRSGPGMEYGIITVAGRGVPLELHGRNASGTWAYIKTPGPGGVFGWVASQYIDTTVSLSSLPVVNIGGQGGGGTVPPPPPDGGQGDGSTGGSDAPYTPGTALITTGALNVRSAPVFGAPVITTVGLGEHVLVIGRNYNSSWYKIRLANGVEGWASSAYIQFIVFPDNIPFLDE